MVVVTRVRAVEGCEKKSQHCPKVFGRGLIGVMNEGVGQTATGVTACMVATGLHDISYVGFTTLRAEVARCVCYWIKCTCVSGWVKRGGASVSQGAHSE
jgi:hypothetical protein